MKNSFVTGVVLVAFLAANPKAIAATATAPTTSPPISTALIPTAPIPAVPVKPGRGQPPLKICSWILRDIARSLSLFRGPRKPGFVIGQVSNENFKAIAMNAFAFSADGFKSAADPAALPIRWGGTFIGGIIYGNPLGLTSDEFLTLIKKMGIPETQISMYVNSFGSGNLKPSYYPQIPEAPVFQKLSDQPESFKELLGKLKDITPAVAVQNAIPLINDLPLRNSVKKNLDNMAEKISEILLEDTESYYQSGGIGGSNTGLIHYIRRQLEVDPVYLRDALKFYSTLKKHDIQSPNYSNQNVPAVWDSGTFDVWALALKICDNDPRRAIRVLGVYGHDEMANQLPYIQNSPLNPAIRILNLFTPTPQSALYMPGSLPNTAIKSRIVNAVKGYREKYDALLPKVQNYGETFRAGHYHIIGSAFVSEELVSAGYSKAAGFKLPVIVNSALGYAYKYIVMPQEIGPDAYTLYHLGYFKPGQKVAMPQGWDDHRFSLAKVMLENYWELFGLTVWDHFTGANWAYGLMKKMKDPTQNIPEAPKAVLPVPPPPPPPPAPLPAAAPLTAYYRSLLLGTSVAMPLLS